MIKKLAIVALMVGLLLSCSVPFSRQELCYRPQDVRTTERIYDTATDTWIQYIPTWGACEPLGFPGEAGAVYVRLQWK